MIPCTCLLLKLFGDIDASFFVNHELIFMIAMLPRHCLVVVGMLTEKTFNFLVVLLFSFKHAIAEWKVLAC